MTRVFVGFDPRQPLAYTVLQDSLHRNAAGRVQVEPLMLSKLPISRRGLTEFTFSRFLVPWLCDYKGTAIFADPDTVATGDVRELEAQADPHYAVQVNKNQPKFEWSSVMLFNNAQCTRLTPEYVNDSTNSLLDLGWGEVGSFTEEWNHCVAYTEPKDAKLYHYTQGLPCWYETAGLPEDEHWVAAHKAANATVSWAELMGQSVHAKPVITRMMRKYGVVL